LLVALTGCWWLLGVGMNVPVLRSLLPCWCWYERPCIEVATTLLVALTGCWWLLVLVCGCLVLVRTSLYRGCYYLAGGSCLLLVCGCWCWYERPCIEVATTLLVALTGCWWFVPVAGVWFFVFWVAKIIVSYCIKRSILFIFRYL